MVVLGVRVDNADILDVGSVSQDFSQKFPVEFAPKPWSMAGRRLECVEVECPTVSGSRYRERPPRQALHAVQSLDAALDSLHCFVDHKWSRVFTGCEHRRACDGDIDGQPMQMREFAGDHGGNLGDRETALGVALLGLKVEMKSL